MDFLILLLLGFGAWKGWNRGLVMALFSMAGLLLGVLLAVKFSARVAAYLAEHTDWEGKWLPFAAFLLVLFAVSMLVNLAGKLVDASMNAILLGPANKLAGAFLYVVLYAFIISLGLYFGTKAGAWQPRDHSLAGWLASWGGAVLSKLSEWLPFLAEALHNLDQPPGSR